MTATGSGAAVRRKEDRRFLTGRGTYTDDINRPGQLYAAFLRSPHAHARLGRIDAARAGAEPGVVAVLTGAELAADGIGGIPCGFAPAGAAFVKEPPRPGLAQGKVRFVGDAVAVVLAESPLAARAAAEQVDVAYDVLPACVTMASARAAGAAALHDSAADNLCFDWSLGDRAATEAAFRKAPRVVRLDLVNNRKIPNAMEPRAALAEYDAGSDSLTLTTTSQNPHLTRLLLAAFVLKIPEHRLRVISPDVGGGFGSKIPHYPEEAVVAWAARRLGRPVKWTAERSESFVSDTHGRDHVTHAELALGQDGTFLGLRVETEANLGAYLSTFGPLVPTFLYATLLTGQYRTPAIFCTVKGVFTNTAPVDAERGAGRPEATYVVERLVDLAARELKIDRALIRRRNFIAKERFPYQTPVALQYDSGDYAPILDEALKLADYAGFATRREDARKRGRLRGIGLSTYIEACGLAPSKVAGAIGARAGLYESAEVRFDPTGSVTVFTGVHAHGQSHETTFAQIVAERLGVPFDKIEVVHGDSGRIPFGMGTYGSRSGAVGGAAGAVACDKIVAKGKRIAGHLLEAAATDIVFKDGSFSVAGTDRRKSIADIALAAYVPHNYPLAELEPGLDEQAFYDPKNFTFPAGAHIAEVEVDPDTGVITIASWVAVDDFGTLINPMIVEGQVHGGVAHGIGQALLEHCVYGAGGQLLSGSFIDYAIPRAGDLPAPKLGTRVTPCPHNPLGVKGCGEAGAIAAPAAVINAVADALGVAHIDMPATPEKIWRLLKAQPAA